MKNIHVLPTDNPSRIAILHDNKLHIGTSFKKDFNVKPQNIYITSDEEIKEGDYGLSKLNEVVRFGKKFKISLYKKIILTTDQDLIKDGVQSINDEFLEWFVKNPSCEEIKTYIVELCGNCGQQYCDNRDCRGYIDEPQYLISFSENTTQRIITYCDGYEVSIEKIIIPKEEPEQHIEFINNNIDEFDKSLNSFKEWFIKNPRC
jgi:hypothetical protein